MNSEIHTLKLSMKATGRTGRAMRQYLNFIQAAILCASLCLGTMSSRALAQSIIFVDVSAADQSDGTSWADAFGHLQDALAVARSGDEIWVRHGTYYPDQGAGVSEGDRDATFTIPSGVSLYGGFEGIESDRDQRDWALHETTLSGDLLHDDFGPLRLGNPLRTDNARHVVFLDSPTEETTINGFTIRGGYLDQEARAQGSAVLFENFSVPPTGLQIQNCHITNNVGVSGTLALRGSVFGSGLQLIVHNTRIDKNWADRGGAMNIEYAPVIIDQSYIAENESLQASGLYVIHGDVYITNSTFAFNQAEARGTIFADSENGGLISVWASRFVGNRTTEEGAGAITISETHLVSVNNVFTGNVAANSGGAMQLVNFTADIVNNVFAFNSAGNQGGAIYSTDKQSTSISNSIFWENEAQTDPHYYSTVHDTLRVYRSIASGGIEPNYLDQGSFWDVNPLFVDPDGADNVPGTLDDDFRLTLGSPAIDAGDNSRLPHDMLDLDGDGDVNERVPVDIIQNVRMFDGGSGENVVDIGVFEFDAPPIGTALYSNDDATLPQIASMNVYPLPARDAINVSWNGRSQTVEMVLYDATGRQAARLYSGIILQDSVLRVPLPELSPGIYILYERGSGLSAITVINK